MSGCPQRFQGGQSSDRRGKSTSPPPHHWLFAHAVLWKVKGDGERTEQLMVLSDQHGFPALRRDSREGGGDYRQNSTINLDEQRLISLNGRRCVDLSDTMQMTGQ